MKKRILLAGPWVGEFGWELFGWQGLIRKLSYNYDKVIVSSRPGHEHIYQDFCDEFIPYTTTNNNTDGSICIGDSGINLSTTIKCDAYIKGSNFNIGYNIFNPTKSSRYFLNEQTYFKYGEKTNTTYDIIFHARNTKKCGTEYRGYSLSKLTQIVKYCRGLKMASIGSNDGSAHIEGTDDLRGINLKELSNLFASCGVVVGSSSGPIHYASLCGAPHIVFSGDKNNKLRYERFWNPFNTKSIYVPTWDPPIKDVMKNIEIELKIKGDNEYE